MKKIFTLLALLLCLQFSTVQAQQKMYVWKNGLYSVISTSEVDSITFATPTSVMVNGHEFVDLGLPSGLKWATCNVGASAPEAYGDYFAWGETEPKTTYSTATYKWRDNNSFSKYTKSDNKTTLDSEDDAATQNWGKGCRMPTEEEFQELLDNCTCSSVTVNGVEGHKFISKTNGAFVFFPVSGYRINEELQFQGSLGHYWSSMLYTSDISGAGYLNFASGNNIFGYFSRYYGFPVRAVCQ